MQVSKTALTTALIALREARDREQSITAQLRINVAIQEIKKAIEENES